MGVIDPKQYDHLKPLFCEAVASRTTPIADTNEKVRAIVSFLADSGYEREEIEALRAYVGFFIDEVERGVVDPFKPPAPPQPPSGQQDLFAAAEYRRAESERALIDQLIAATRLYDSSDAIKELFDFTIRLREFAPFNAMLLHIQKPGLTHAASARDWLTRFGRAPKRGARPLMILRTMGPVDFVFDILDTEGRELPANAFAFPTFGDLTDAHFDELMFAVRRDRIDLLPIDAGDGQAGWIRLLKRSEGAKHIYELAYNRNHPAPTRLVTVAHELAHLHLGHLGGDRMRRIPDRSNTSHALCEVEAEMTAYLVAKRNGLQPRSESYLSRYEGAFDDLNLYAITRAANAVETSLGISAAHLWRAW